jgi:thiol-disulfide isomerase/thioredoxin
MTRPITIAAMLLAAVLLALGLYFSSEKLMPPPPQPASTEAPPMAAPDIAWLPPGKRQPLPDLHFVDDAGKAMTLADFRGRVILLNIWATWCAPCREEMPTLDQLQARRGGGDFEVVALSIDQKGMDAVKGFLSEIGIRALRPYLDRSGAIGAAVGLAGVPVTLLVDRQGREIGRKLGVADWNSPEAAALIERALKADQ